MSNSRSDRVFRGLYCSLDTGAGEGESWNLSAVNPSTKTSHWRVLQRGHSLLSRRQYSHDRTTSLYTSSISHPLPPPPAPLVRSGGTRCIGLCLCLGQYIGRDEGANELNASCDQPQAYGFIIEKCDGSAGPVAADQDRVQFRTPAGEYVCVHKQALVVEPDSAMDDNNARVFIVHCNQRRQVAPGPSPRAPPVRTTSRRKGAPAPAQPSARAVLKKPDFFFAKDSPEGRPPGTTNRQPPTANRQPPTATNRQPACSTSDLGGIDRHGPWCCWWSEREGARPRRYWNGRRP